MKKKIILVLILCAMAIAFTPNVSSVELKQVDQYQCNEINRQNTWLGENGSVELEVNGSRLRVGLWPTTHPTLGEAPFAALIVWTPAPCGWVTLARLNPLYNDDLGMDAGTPEDDLKNYMWFMEQAFSPIVKQHLLNVGAIELPNTNWEKILYLMDSVRFEDLNLKFDWEL